MAPSRVTTGRHPWTPRGAPTTGRALAPPARPHTLEPPPQGCSHENCAGRNRKSATSAHTPHARGPRCVVCACPLTLSRTGRVIQGARRVLGFHFWQVQSFIRKRAHAHLHTVTHAQKRKRAGGRITAVGRRRAMRRARRPAPGAAPRAAARRPAPGNRLINHMKIPVARRLSKLL